MDNQHGKIITHLLSVDFSSKERVLLVLITSSFPTAEINSWLVDAIVSPDASDAVDGPRSTGRAFMGRVFTCVETEPEME